MRIHKKKLFVIAGLIVISIAAAGCGVSANEDAAMSAAIETDAANETNTPSFYDESVATFVEVRSITQKDSWGSEPKKNVDLFLAMNDGVFKDHMQKYFIRLNNMEVLSAKEQALLMSLSDLRIKLGGLAGSLASPESFNPDTVKEKRAEYITAEEKVVALIEQFASK